MKKILAVFMALMMSVSLVSCGNDTEVEENKPTPKPTQSAELKKLTKNTINATITLENGDEINLELYPDLAPQTVENFIELADDGFYDETIFHRVIEGFMIQGGGYDEDLKEVKADSIFGEFASNGFENELSHERGVISMARIANNPDSASSQFFIMHEDYPSLDGDYAAFGRVVDEESLMVVDDIATVRTGTVSSAGLNDVPVTPVVIKSIMVDTGNPMEDVDDTQVMDEEDEEENDSKKDKKLTIAD